MTTNDEHWWIKRQPHSTKALDAGDAILMPSKSMLREYIEQQEPGSASTVKAMRTELAVRYDAAITCPVTTNLHLAELAREAHESGVTLPVWRVTEPGATALKRAGIDDSWIKDHRDQERTA